MLAWRLQKKQEYIRCYGRKLERLQLSEEDTCEDALELEELERVLDVEDIVQFRAIAKGRLLQSSLVHQGSEADAEAVQRKRGWLNWMTLGVLGGAATDFVGALSEDDVLELYKATELSEESTDTVPSTEDSTKGQCKAAFSCHVSKAACTLRSSYSRNSILQASLQTLTLNLRTWMDSTTVTLAVAYLEAVDHRNPYPLFNRMIFPKGHVHPQGQFPHSATIADLPAHHGATVDPKPAPNSQLESDPVLQIECQLQNGDGGASAGMDIDVCVQPLDIIFNPRTIKRLETFFSHPTTVPTHHEMVLASMNGLETHWARTYTKVMYVQRGRQPVGLRITLRSPAVVIPDSNAGSSGAVLALNLGDVVIVGKPNTEARKRLVDELASSVGPAQRARDSQESDSLLSAVVDNVLYDKFVLKLTGVQSIVVRQPLSWRMAFDAESSSVELVERFNLKMRLSMCALANDPTLTKIKGSAEASRIHLHLSRRKIQQLKAVIGSLLAGESEESAGQGTHTWSNSNPTGFGRTPSRSDILDVLLSRSTNESISSRMTSSSESRSFSSLQRGFLSSVLQRRLPGSELEPSVAEDEGRRNPPSRGIGERIRNTPSIEMDFQTPFIVVEASLAEDLTSGEGARQPHSLALILQRIQLRLKQRLFEEDTRFVIHSLHILDLNREEAMACRFLAYPLDKPQNDDPRQSTSSLADMSSSHGSISRLAFSVRSHSHGFLNRMLSDGNLVEKVLRAPLDPMLKVRVSSRSLDHSHTERNETDLWLAATGIQLDLHQDVLLDCLQFMAQVQEAEPLSAEDSAGSKVFSRAQFRSQFLDDFPLEVPPDMLFHSRAGNSRRRTGRGVSFSLGSPDHEPPILPFLNSESHAESEEWLSRAVEHSRGSFRAASSQSEREMHRSVSFSSLQKGRLSIDENLFSEAYNRRSDFRAFGRSASSLFHAMESWEGTAGSHTDGESGFTSLESSFFPCDSSALKDKLKWMNPKQIQEEVDNAAIARTILLHFLSITDLSLSLWDNQQRVASLNLPSLQLAAEEVSHVLSRNQERRVSVHAKSFELLGPLRQRYFGSYNEDEPCEVQVVGCSLSSTREGFQHPAFGVDVLLEGAECTVASDFVLGLKAFFEELHSSAVADKIQLDSATFARGGSQKKKDAIMTSFSARNLRLVLPQRHDLHSLPCCLLQFPQIHALSQASFHDSWRNAFDQFPLFQSLDTHSQESLAVQICGASMSVTDIVPNAGWPHDRDNRAPRDPFTVLYQLSASLCVDLTPSHDSAQKVRVRFTSSEVNLLLSGEGNQSIAQVILNVMTGNILRLLPGDDRASSSDSDPAPADHIQLSCQLEAVKLGWSRCLSSAAPEYLVEVSHFQADMESNEADAGILAVSWRRVELSHAKPLFLLYGGSREDDRLADFRGEPMVLLTLLSSGADSVDPSKLSVDVDWSRGSIAGIVASVTDVTLFLHINSLIQMAESIESILPREQSTEPPSQSEQQAETVSTVTMRATVEVSDIRVCLPSFKQAAAEGCSLSNVQQSESGSVMDVEETGSESSATDPFVTRYHVTRPHRRLQSMPLRSTSPNVSLSSTVGLPHFDRWAQDGRLLSNGVGEGRDPPGKTTFVLSVGLKLTALGKLEGPRQNWVLGLSMPSCHGDLQEFSGRDEGAEELRVVELSGFCTDATVVVDRGEVEFTVTAKAGEANVFLSSMALKALASFEFEPIRVSGEEKGSADIHGTLSADVSSISLVMVSTRSACSAPLVELLMADVAVNSQLQANVSSTTVAAAMAANYLNEEKVAWEPLSEPWKFTLHVQKSEPTDNAVGKAVVSLKSSETLNLNVTESMISVLVQLSDIVRRLEGSPQGLSGSEKQGASAPLQQYVPYRVSNCTGMSMRFWFEVLKRRRSSGVLGSALVTETLASGTLQPGQSAPLCISWSWLKSHISQNRAFPNELYHGVKVQVDGMLHPSPHLKLHKLERGAFLALFSPASDTADVDSSLLEAQILYSVCLQDRVKVITLSSPVSVKNSLSIPMQVRVESLSALPPQTLQPGDTFPLPLLALQSAKLCWRPLLLPQYAWSDFQAIEDIVKPPSSDSTFSPLKCASSDQPGDSFFFCSSVAAEDVRLLPSFTPDLERGKRAIPVGPLMQSRESSPWSAGSDRIRIWEVSIYPSLAVDNLLPRPTMVMVQTLSGDHIQGLVKAGESLYLHQVPPHLVVSIFFSPLGFKKSNSVLLPPADVLASAAQESAADSLQSDKEIWQPTEFIQLKQDDAMGLAIYAEIEKSVRRSSGCRKVAIMCPLWMYNATDMCLAVREDGASSSFQILPQVQPRNSRGRSRPKYNPESIPGVVHDSSARLGLKGALDFPQREKRIITSAMISQDKSLVSHFSGGVIPAGSLERATQPATADLDCAREGSGPLEPYGSLFSSSLHTSTLESTEFKVKVGVVKHGPRSPAVTGWSEPVLLETQGGVSVVTVPSGSSSGAYVFSLSSLPIHGLQESRSRSVTFRPRFVVANSTCQALFFKQQGTDVSFRVPPGQTHPFHWSDTRRRCLVSVGFEEHGWDWSGGFNPEELGDIQMKLRNHRSGVLRVLKVDITMPQPLPGELSPAQGSRTGVGTFFILASEDRSGFMPYRIDNFSREVIRFHQQRCDTVDDVLRPHNSCSYLWDEPCFPHKLVLEVPGGVGNIGMYRLDEVKDYPLVTLPASFQRPERKLQVIVKAAGPIRVLTVLDVDMHPVEAVSSAPIPTPGPAAAPPWLPEAVQSVDPQFDGGSVALLHLVAEVPSLGVSVVDSVPNELMYLSINSLRVVHTQTVVEDSTLLTVASVQVDNQLRNALYPVLLEASHPEHAAVHLTLSRLHSSVGGVDCFKHIGLALAPMRLEMEERWILRMVQWLDVVAASRQRESADEETMHSSMHGSFWKEAGPSAEAASSAAEAPSCLLPPMRSCWPYPASLMPVGGPPPGFGAPARSASKIYIESIHIAPLELTVSFASAPWLPEESRGAAAKSLLGAVGVAFQRQMLALADVEGAQICLAALSLNNFLGPMEDMNGRLAKHYLRQVLQLLYKVLGSADFLGNPMGFIASLGSGMWDFVSAPAVSLVQRPQEVLKGLSAGTTSLFQNTVFALSNSATRISGAASKGVSALVLDKEYAAELERRQQQYDPHASDVLSALFQGLTGVLEYPVKGLEQGGIPGMLSGAAIGLLGAVAKPTASILDLAGKSARSIRNSTRPQIERPSRVRTPRYVSATLPLQPYSWENAIGHEMLEDINSGFSKAERLVACFRTVEALQFVLLTDQSIALVRSGGHTHPHSSGHETDAHLWEVEWKVILRTILRTETEGCNLSVLQVKKVARAQMPGGSRLNMAETLTGSYSNSPLCYQVVTLNTEETCRELHNLIQQLKNSFV